MATATAHKQDDVVTTGNNARAALRHAIASRTANVQHWSLHEATIKGAEILHGNAKKTLRVLQETDNSQLSTKDRKAAISAAEKMVQDTADDVKDACRGVPERMERLHNAEAERQSHDIYVRTAIAAVVLAEPGYHRMKIRCEELMQELARLQPALGKLGSYEPPEVFKFWESERRSDYSLLTSVEKWIADLQHDPDAEFPG